MKFLSLLFIFLCLSSCLEKPKNQAGATRDLQNLLYKTSSMKSLTTDDLVWPEIKTPLNIKMALMSFDQFCLWGLRTQKEILLGIVALEETQECRMNLAREPKWSWTFAAPIGLRMMKEQMKFLQIKDNSDHKFEIKIELPSIATSSPQAFQRFDEGLPWRGIPAVIFTTEDITHSMKTYPSLAAEFTTSRQIACHKFNEFCEETHEYDCEKCDKGWIEVFDHGCPQGGSKYCAVEQCGRKNQPACLLGIDWVSPDIAKNCTIEDPRVFCSPETTMYCDPDGVAICL